MRHALWKGVLLSVLAIAPLGAAGNRVAGENEATEAPAEHPVRAELVAEHASVRPGGATRIGVLFDLEPDWHIYAEDPGDAGLPTKVAWSAPGGVSFGPLQWPPPQRLVDPGDITTFGYTGTLILSSKLSVSSRAALGGTLPIEAKVTWLACKSICIPGSAQLALGLPVSGSAPVFSPHAQLFEHTQ